MALDDNIAILTPVPPFSELEAEALKLVAFAAETRSFHAGEVVFRRDALSDGGYVVMSGEIALTLSDGQQAGERICRSGALLGELALLIPTRNPAMAVATQDSVLLKVGRPLFLRTLEEFPKTAERLNRKLAGRLQAFSSRIRQIGEGQS
jgi:CRP-like cAMP-binding protein